MFDSLSSMSAAVIVLLTAAAMLCIAGTLVLLVLLRRRRMKKKPVSERSVRSLPGGGGHYTLLLEGMNCEHCRENAEAALNAFPGIQAAVDLKTQTATVAYTGLPDMELLDKLKAAVEGEGFTVKEVR